MPSNLTCPVAVRRNVTVAMPIDSSLDSTFAGRSRMLSLERRDSSGIPPPRTWSSSHDISA